MEKIQSICALRDLMLAIHQLENALYQQTSMELNEAMLLCSLVNETVASTQIASRIGLKTAHTSKLLSRLEERGLVQRHLSQDDRRMIRYSLSPLGIEKVSELRAFAPDLEPIRLALNTTLS